MKIQARPISPGRAEGKALVSLTPISFLGGVDRDSGRILDPSSNIHGEALAQRVLVFPHGKGSTVGSYVVHDLRARGLAPVAMVCHRAEAIVATGAIMAAIPMVDGVPPDLFRPGDHLVVDGDEGWIEIQGVEGYEVVTSFLESDGAVLILKRSSRVGSFQGQWAGVSGYLEPGDESPKARALTEILEETGVKSPSLVRTADAVLARGHLNPQKVFIVHPFLWHVPDRSITLDWEHDEYRWIDPGQLKDYSTVPGLDRVLTILLEGLGPEKRDWEPKGPLGDR